METVISCVFFLILSFLAKKLPERLTFCKAFNANEEDKYSPSEF